MPPPVTPSPHRFVIKKQPPPPRSQLAEESTPRPANTQQFNTTPRFTFSSTPKPTGTQNIPSSTPAGRYSTPARQTPKAKENIDDPPDEYPTHPPLHDSIETQDEFDTKIGFPAEGAEDEYEINPRSSKRRRISPSPADIISEQTDDLLSSSLPIISSPISHRQNPITSTTGKPKFLLSTPLPPSTPQSTTPTTFLKPPRFRPPDPAETHGHIDPLPEQFSPHRKGRQYVNGGLAAEVRDWLINIDSSVSSSSHKANIKGTKNKDREWIVKIKVEEISGGGREMCLVRGRQVRDLDGEEMLDGLGDVRVMLAGEGAGMGLQRGKEVQVGVVVGIKGPVWEIVVEGVKWGVGVDWKVL
ncbi:hypothetical protein OCU04_004815 [Sclerotinia nivalis]|uniref:Uncharacterized protein n=1 Tax=Sclerotinia nivalis TaxID=352851 RepID=A0A9X0DMC8_9HELO|nr:hypothetical protein OCU04_004815 [Sclerotinia nivalis]